MEKRVLNLFAFLFLSMGMVPNYTQPPAPSTSQDLSSPRSQMITIEFGGTIGLAYNPPDVFIEPGDSVLWKGSFVSHPLVSDDSLWQMVDSGSEFTFTFNQPGVYRFHCFFHGSLGMSGTVTVGYRDYLPLIHR